MSKVRLGDIAETCLGKMLDKEKNRGEYHSYLANANVQWGQFKLDNLPLMKFEEHEHERYGLQYGDLVICEGGEPGRCAIWRNEISNMKIQKALHRVRAKENKVLDIRYLYYWFCLAGKIKLLDRYFIETTIKHLPGDRLKDLQIELPNINKQKNIADILELLDQKIQNNNKIIAELEAMAKTIYDYWFVQFDFPDENGKPYRTSGGKMEYNAELKREIPAGWDNGNLFSIASFSNGLACQKHRPQAGEKSLPVVKIKEMHDGITNVTERVSYDIPTKNKITNGDILFSWSATLEVMYWAGEDAGLNQHIFKVQPKDYFSKEYVFCQLSSYVINFVKMAEARKTTMGHITIDHLNQSVISIPPQKFIENFNFSIKPLHLSTLKLHQENQELTTLRDWLLPMLMNGQATVE